MFIIGSFDRFFSGYIRKEYTRDLEDGHGHYLPCVIHGLRVVQGKSLEFQCVLTEYGAGAGFLAPIEAFCWKIPDRPRAPGDSVDYTYVQPWDCFSSEFGVHAFEFNRRMKAQILPDRRGARYRFSIDFTGSSLADMSEQHKHLHVMEMDDGSIGAFPNNRVLWIEPAMWDKPFESRPDFKALSGEWMAE
jgi:hypothetical protein